MAGETKLEVYRVHKNSWSAAVHLYGKAADKKNLIIEVANVRLSATLEITKFSGWSE